MTIRHPVTDLIWMGGTPVAAEKVSGLDLAATGDPVCATRRLRGQFALHQVDEGTHLLARDALGVNKLFFAIDSGGNVASSNYWIDLVRAGHPASAVWSVPSGHLIQLSPRRRELQLIKYAALRFHDTDHTAGPDLAGGIRRALDETFRMIAAAIAGRPVFVTVSGGLDSTTVAALARRHLGEFTAVTFSIDDDSHGALATEDLRYARRVAADLRVPLREVHATADELVDLIDVALCYGQDWRDFNVHCALVNAAIGRALAADRAQAGAGSRPILLTGDTMNELMADYQPVTYRGREFYTLPRIPAGRLRRFLVQGLDAGDREIGVFSHFGLDVIQPYALCAEAFAAVPGDCLDHQQAKQRLMFDVMGPAIPSYVYERPKVRAQVGGTDEVRGTLPALVDRGIDCSWLERRFGHLFELEPGQMSGAIRAGFYRFPTSYPVVPESPP